MSRYARVVVRLTAPQERVAILKILKKDFQVNEQLLRVGILRVNERPCSIRPL